LQRVAIILIVIDDEDTGEVRCHEHLEFFSISGREGRRWLSLKALWRVSAPPTPVET
jgi:hypothetical protein